jgi:ABC-type sugar transport system permease subunit
MWPLIPAAVFLLGFLIIVLVYLFSMSFSVAEEMHTLTPSLQNVKAVFEMPEFREALHNTTLFVLAGTPLELLAGLLLALLLYHHGRFRSSVRSMLIIPVAIPALVTATLLFILFDFPGGHINHMLMGKYAIFPQILEAPVNWRGSKFFSLGVALLGKVWRDTPISMLILLAGVNAVDPELTDAAKTMGAGALQRFRMIILPLIMPALSAVVLLRSIEMWKEFIFPFVLAGQHDLLGTLIESLYNDWGHSHMAAFVALVLVGCIMISAIVFIKLLDMLQSGLLRRQAL